MKDWLMNIKFFFFQWLNFYLYLNIIEFMFIFYVNNANYVNYVNNVNADYVNNKLMLIIFIIT